MTILSLLLLQLLLERLQIPQKGLLKLEKTAVLQATFKGLYPVYPKCPRMDRSTWDSFFMYKYILLHCPLDKIHSWKLFAFGKIFAHGKVKSRRKSLIKKKKEQSLRSEKEYHLSRKEKKSFVNDYYWRRFPLAPRFRAKNSRQNKICHQ